MSQENVEIVRRSFDAMGRAMSWHCSPVTTATQSSCR
jgi:hypothetical protein